VVEKTLSTLQYIIDKYQLKIGRHSPVEMPNMIRENLAELFNELGFTVGAENRRGNMPDGTRGNGHEWMKRKGIPSLKNVVNGEI
jgi:hypothetical protein